MDRPSPGASFALRHRLIAMNVALLSEELVQVCPELRFSTEVDVEQPFRIVV